MDTSKNKQVVKKLYAAFGRGDIASVTALLAADVTWQVPGTVPHYSGTYKGASSVIRFFQKLKDNVVIEAFQPAEFVAEGEIVIVTGWSRGRVKSSGGVYENRWVMVFGLRDGRIAKFEEYADTQALALAHGIAGSVARTASGQRKAVARLMIPFIFAIGGVSTVWGQSAIDRLQPLVETSARRLVLAKEVALAKWDTRLPVEDPTREAQVITAAAKDGESKGLNRTFVSNFFAAQIEANKLVQHSLLAEWHRAGRAPKHPPVSLTEDIRPQLDEIEAALIAELAETKDIRANASCRGNTAKAVRKYLAHRHLGRLLTTALDRAMEANCSGGQED